MSNFAERVAAALKTDAPALVARWQAQARAVAPRVVARRVGDAVADGVVTQAIGALGCALRRTPRCQDDVLRAGWEFGGRAHARGMSLHNMMKELDLLEAMVLYVAERTAEAQDESAATGGGRDVASAEAASAEAASAPVAGPSAAEVMGAARRLHRSFAALRLAATKGFTHAYVEALRGHYRTLRHDLRNPIGTIRSAVALMDDESLPIEVRFGQRYRAMVTRNATSLDALVGAALGDAQVNVPAMALQDVSLAELALTVRRDLREDADAAGCGIELAPSLAASSLPAVRVDSTAFELVLRSLVDAALGHAASGSVVTIGLRALLERQAVVLVTYAPSQPRTTPGRPAAGGPVPTLAVELAQRSGGRVWREDDATLVLEIPIEAHPAVDALAVEGTSAVAVTSSSTTTAEVTTTAAATTSGTGRRSDSPVALDSFGGSEYGGGVRAQADKLPRGGGPPDGHVAGSAG